MQATSASVGSLGGAADRVARWLAASRKHNRFSDITSRRIVRSRSKTRPPFVAIRDVNIIMTCLWTGSMNALSFHVNESCHVNNVMLNITINTTAFDCDDTFSGAQYHSGLSTSF